MNSVRFYATLALLCLPYTAQALTLLDAVKLAELKDPAYLSIKANLAAAKLGPDVARADLLPKISVSATVSSNRLQQDRTDLNGGLISLGGTTDYDSSDLIARITQPLFDLSAYRQYQSSLIQKARDETLAVDKLQNFRMQVVTAYIDVLRAEAELKLAQGRETTLKKRLEDAQLRLKLGMQAKLDVLETQAQFDQVKSQRIAANNIFDTKKNILASKVGIQQIELPPLKNNLPLIPFVPIDQSKWKALAKKRSPSLLASKLDIEIAEKDKSTIEAGYLPQLNIVASVGQRDVSGGDNLAINLNNGRTEQVGVELRWELFGGGKTTNRSKQLALRNNALREDYHTREIEIDNRVGTLFLTIQNDAERVQANRSSVASAVASRNAIEAGYKLGTHSVIELSTAENRLQVAQQDRDRAYFDYIQNSLNLHATAGVLYYSILARYDQVFTPINGH
jgi:outer membrane protein